jgi:hypothetical protein
MSVPHATMPCCFTGPTGLLDVFIQRRSEVLERTASAVVGTRLPLCVMAALNLIEPSLKYNLSIQLGKAYGFGRGQRLRCCMECSQRQGGEILAV